MENEQKHCVKCNTVLDKNIIGLNYKYLGRTVRQMQCLKCLSEFLEVTPDELYKQIDYFKETGCVFFE